MLQRISFQLCLTSLLTGIPLCNSFAQFETTPIDRMDRMWYENELLRKTTNTHTAIYPWRKSEVALYSRRSALLPDSIERVQQKRSWLYRKVWQEDLFTFEGDDHHITINPALAFAYGTESESTDYETIYQNSRGFHVEGRLGKHFTFYSTLVESLARFPAHTRRQTLNTRVVPGYWLTKGFRNSSFDFAYAAGEIAYTPNDIFHFRLGRGKQFIGEGYRSLLISDNSVNYPFFRIETTFGKVKYVNLWAVMNDTRREIAIDEDIFAKKYLSMHYLSINIGRRLNIGLFEGIMWGDELQRYGFDINFLNPVILFRPVEFAQGFSGGNVLMGLNGSYQFGHGIKAYGQLSIDEFTFSEIRQWSEKPWRNMYSIQLGVKWGDALGIPNLFLRTEYNLVRPHTYSHRDILTNWAHYAQPLAHPFGANFRELLFQVHYRKGRWLGRAAFHNALLGRDEDKDANWGGDIFKSFEVRSADTGVVVGNGISSNFTFWRAEIAYIINPSYNLRFQVGAQNRQEDARNVGLPNSRIIYLGLRTNMYEIYQDF